MYDNNKLLMEFSNVSDEVLKVELNKIIHEYRKSKKIEEIILEIIYDLGYSKKLPINHELDNRFKKITKVSELRKIDQPKKMGKIIITKEDIINALYEIKEREAKWVDEHIDKDYPHRIETRWSHEKFPNLPSWEIESILCIYADRFTYNMPY